MAVLINENPRTEWDDEYVICPYCGQRSGDCWEWVTDFQEIETCENCGGQFSYYAETSVTYITRPVSPPPVVVEDDGLVATIALEEVADALGGSVDVVGDLAGDIVDGVGDIVEGVGDLIASIFEDF